jgi:hypothetical protein
MKDVFEEMVKKELQDQDFHIPIYSMAHQGMSQTKTAMKEQSE